MSVFSGVSFFLKVRAQTQAWGGLGACPPPMEIFFIDTAQMLHFEGFWSEILPSVIKELTPLVFCLFIKVYMESKSGEISILVCLQKYT